MSTVRSLYEARLRRNAKHRTIQAPPEVVVTKPDAYPPRNVDPAKTGKKKDPILAVSEDYKQSAKMKSAVKYLVQPKLSPMLKARLEKRKAKKEKKDGYKPTEAALARGRIAREKMSYTPKKNYEEVEANDGEQLDELSNRTMNSYIGKRLRQKPKSPDKQKKVVQGVERASDKIDKREDQAARVRAAEYNEETLDEISKEQKQQDNSRTRYTNLAKWKTDAKKKYPKAEHSTHTDGHQVIQNGGIVGSFRHSNGEGYLREETLNEAKKSAKKKVIGKEKSVKRKYLGNSRGTTKTGKPAHQIIINPTVEKKKRN